MECRLALLLGRPPSEIRALPMSDISQLVAYWDEEPWGPTRDNLHAGMIAAAVLNSGFRRLRRPAVVKDFMLQPKKAAGSEARGSLLSSLRLMAKKKPKKK